MWRLNFWIFWKRPIPMNRKQVTEEKYGLTWCFPEKLSLVTWLPSVLDLKR